MHIDNRRHIQPTIPTNLSHSISPLASSQVNRELQGFMYVMLKDEHSVAAKRSLEVCYII